MCRHPTHQQRPSFDKIVNYLKQPEDKLLYWADKDIITGHRANVLGAPISESKELYVDLQHTYKSDDSM